MVSYRLGVWRSEEMKEYVEFELLEKKPKTNTYVVKTRSGENLGTISWYFPWRQYVFYPYDQTIWSEGCLQQVTDFIHNLMQA